MHSRALVVTSFYKYIEANPVRAGLVRKAGDWVWSSAFARLTGNGVVPDACNIPVEHALRAHFSFPILQFIGTA